jgi:hypothetical protein
MSRLLKALRASSNSVTFGASGVGLTGGAAMVSTPSGSADAGVLPNRA